MMADQLTGRALDEAAAIAMGWRCLAKTAGASHLSKWTDGKTLQHPGPTPRMRLPRFHTDPATIPEMLAFLAPWWVAEQINHEPDVIRAYWDDGFELFSATGTTLNEALARLVVEVARARGQQ